MAARPSTLERGFELANTGEYASISAIRKQLKNEGYFTTQLFGRGLATQLRKICLAAKAARAAGG